MDWDEALSFSDIVEDIASEWSIRIKDDSIKDDLKQHLYMRMVLKVDPSRAKKDVYRYVKAACWKIAQKFCTSKRYGPCTHMSVDDLPSFMQIDEYGDMVYSSGRSLSRFKVNQEEDEE